MHNKTSTNIEHNHLQVSFNGAYAALLKRLTNLGNRFHTYASFKQNLENILELWISLRCPALRKFRAAATKVFGPDLKAARLKRLRFVADEMNIDLVVAFGEIEGGSPYPFRNLLPLFTVNEGNEAHVNKLIARAQIIDLCGHLNQFVSEHLYRASAARKRATHGKKSKTA